MLYHHDTMNRATHVVDVVMINIIVEVRA